MIIKYFDRAPGGGLEVKTSDEYVEIFVDYEFIWGRTAVLAQYDLPEKIVCKINNLISIETEKPWPVIVEAPARPKGEWKTYYHGDKGFTYTCSVCGSHGEGTLFCPHCGAEMEDD